MGAELNKTMNDFGSQVKRLAQINVGRSVNGRRIDTTGKLRKSIKYVIKIKGDEVEVGFLMQDYGLYVDAGVVGKKKKILGKWNKSVFNRGSGYSSKFPDVGAIKKWINDKPIRMRNSTGQFVGKTQKRIDTTAYLIGRKIYNEGLQPKLFFSDPFNKEYKSLPDDAVNAYANDLENNLKEEN